MSPLGPRHVVASEALILDGRSSLHELTGIAAFSHGLQRKPKQPRHLQVTLAQLLGHELFHLGLRALTIDERLLRALDHFAVCITMRMINFRG